MNTRIMAVALVVSLLGVGIGHADTVVFVKIVPISDPTDPAGEITGDWTGGDRTIIVVGVKPDEASITFPIGCGSIANETFSAVEAIKIRPGGFPAYHFTMYFSSDFDLLPGDRINPITGSSIQCCGDDAFEEPLSCSTSPATKRAHRMTGSVTASSNAGSALFSSPFELDTDALGVVTGQPNDDGTHTVVFKKQGSSAQQVNIATDDELLAADVLRDLIDLGYGEETGEHLYLAEIEW